MYKIRNALCAIAVLTSINSFSSTIIDFTLRDGLQSIKYFGPLDGFGNRNVPCELKSDYNGKISIFFSIDKPTFIKFIIGGSALWLLTEPNDSIHVETKPVAKHGSIAGITITGNNSIGHEFYNKNYNYIPIDKFTGIRKIFDENANGSADSIFEKIKIAIASEVMWVDSLYHLGQITKYYSDYMKTGIESALAWEVGNLCDQNFSKDKKTILIASKIKNELFAHIDPLNRKLYTCGIGFSYYSTYFEELYKYRSGQIDTSLVIIDEMPEFSLAPKELQRHLWGQMLSGYREISPTQHDYCKLFNKFKSIYKTGDYVDYFEKSGICNPKKPEFVKLLDTTDNDLFRLISENFYRKRLFIDLWATWCAPCKMEFADYDSSFYEFMKEKKIDLVFVSIDKPGLKSKWENEVKALNLRGYHVLADKTLQASIKEIVYDDGTVIIPRYILVDENGKIFSTDFQRPSDPMFRQEIERIFQKK